jgi:hypothetical protein
MPGGVGPSLKRYEIVFYVIEIRRCDSARLLPDCYSPFADNLDPIKIW